MLNSLKPFDSVVVRLSSFPFAKADELSEKHLLGLLDDKLFCEAIWLASPELYYEAQKWKRGELTGKKRNSVLYSLSRYYMRLCTRTIPFGLFAGISIAPVSTVLNENITEPRADNILFKRVTRLDMEFMCSLIHSIESDRIIRERLKYQLNTSLYRVNDSYRFYEYYYDNKEKKYLLSSIPHTDYLEQLIDYSKNRFSSFTDLVFLFTRLDIETEEAVDFIHELIDNQVLVSNLQPPLASTDLLVWLIDALEEIKIPGYTYILKSIAEDLKRLDQNKINDVSAYEHIIEEIAKLQIDFKRSRLFQVDMYRYLPEHFCISQSHIDRITEAIQQLAPLYNMSSPPGVEKFKSMFNELYERQEAPLSAILDCDLGLPFNNTNEANIETPLTDGITISEKERSLTITPTDTFKLKLLYANANKKSVDIHPYLSDEAPAEETFNDNSCWLVVFSTAIVDGKEHIIVKYSGGTNIISILARFGHLDEAIHKMLTDIASQEVNLNTDVIYADIIHLPEDRAGNVVSRPEIYPYQIAFLGNTICDSDKVITIDDLMVSVYNDRILLKSKRLNKYIIPRLSNAHAFNGQSTLAIYKFLCSLQYHAKLRNADITWGAGELLSNFLPRITFKDIILQPATWRITREDIGDVITAFKNSDDSLVDKVYTWQAKMNIPDKFVLTNGDQELYVNLKNKLSLLTFLDEVKNKSKFSINEFLQAQLPENGISKHVHEIQVPFYNHKPTVLKHPPVITNDNNGPKRHFVPGSEVVYFKVYGGNKTLEKIFLAKIFPFIECLSEQDVISKWHFIKFSDPKYHLRIRLFLNDVEDYGAVLQQLWSIIDPLIRAKIFHDVSFNVFNRELERYGGHLVHYAEAFFWHDSKCVSSILKMLYEIRDTETFRWMFALADVDWILNAAGLNDKEKLEMSRVLREGFFNEFGGGAVLKKQLSAGYRKCKKMIETAIPLFDKAMPNEFHMLVNPFFQERHIAIKSIFDELADRYGRKVLIEQLVSYIHMSLNRIFIAKSRQQELVIYDFLSMSYKSMASLKMV